MYSGVPLWVGGCVGYGTPMASEAVGNISRLLAFVGKCRIVGGVKEAKIFMPILPTVSQVR